MAHARLHFATASGQEAIELGPVNRLGRHPDCSILLLDKLVSKEHCTLERRDGVIVLRDLGSLGGTYVNGERVRGERALKHGDEIALGATRARYDDGFGSTTFAPLAICPGVVRQSTEAGALPPGRDGGGGFGGAPAAMAPQPPRRGPPD